MRDTKEEAINFERYNKSLSFIVKTSFDCNLDCAYCYEGHQKKGQRMPLAVVQELTAKAASYARETGASFSFVWHGGEPLLMGQDFYKRAIGFQKEKQEGFAATNCVQTNGVLLSSSFTKTLKDLGIKVGVSLDGPPSIHDAQRRMKGRKTGSFMAAYEALRTLCDHDIEPGALAVFTRNTYNRLDEFYDFFSERELSVKMNPLFIGGNAEDASAQGMQVNPQEYKKALIHLFDRWTADEGKDFSFDPFCTITRTMTSGFNYCCSQSGRCASLLKVFPNGDIGACGLLPYEKFKLGNIFENDFSKILASPYRQYYIRARESLTKTCGKTCEHFDLCHGGCVSYSYPLHGRHSDKTYYCESLKGLFAHMKKKINPILQDVRQKKAQEPKLFCHPA